MKLKILFVDDEPNVLNSLKRLFHPNKIYWDMDFAHGGQSALDLLKNKEYDVVISDMFMPDIDGAELLKWISENSPGTMRFILSGYSDLELVKKTLVPAHKFFHKPCPKEKMEKEINWIIFLRKLLPDKKIRDQINQLGMLPVNPFIYAMLKQVLYEKDLNEFKKIIYFDPGMFLNIYKIIMNSFFIENIELQSFFKLLHKIDIKVLNLIFESQDTFKIYDFYSQKFSLNIVWRHSYRTAFLAKKIAETTKKDFLFIENSFISGLLHSVGVLLMILLFKSEYIKFFLDNIYEKNFLDLEQNTFNINHATLGAYLVGIWGGNKDIVEAIAFHNRPSLMRKKNLSPLSIVHFCEKIDKNNIVGKNIEPVEDIDLKHYSEIGNLDIVKMWYKISLLYYKKLHENVNKKFL